VLLSSDGGGGNQTLDLGGTGLLLLALLLGELTLDNELTNVILLGEVEELSDLGGSLGAKTAGNGGVGQTGKLGITLLDDNEVDDGQVSTSNATTDGLSAALTVTERSVVAGGTIEEDLNSVVNEDTLLHGNTLLVHTTGDLEDVALELVTESIGGDLLGDTLIVEDADLIIRFK
jgi:hypothetical protein